VIPYDRSLLHRFNGLAFIEEGLEDAKTRVRRLGWAFSLPGPATQGARG
jgi:hypothetical protein